MSNQPNNWPPKMGAKIFGLFIFYFVSLGLPYIGTPLYPDSDDFWLFIFLPALAVYLIILAIVWPRFTSRVLTIQPPPAVQPATVEDLLARIDHINDLDVPFQVKPDGELGRIIEWKYIDAKWAELIAAKQVTAMALIKLRFDPKKKIARAQDRAVVIRKKTDLLKGKLSFSYGAFRGINLLQYSRGFEGGLIFQDGRFKIGTAYNYKFEFSEMKNPLIQVVGGSGWKYKPVVSLWKWLGG